MRRRRRLISDDESLQDIWPSFTDVTSTIALILFVLVLLAYVRNLISSKQLDAYAQQIKSSEQKLGLLSIELDRTNRQIAVGQAQLTASQLKLEEQQGIIVASHTELDNLRARLSSIALLRVEVLEKVKQSIEAVLGGAGAAGAPLVRIGDNGNIVINEAVVFEYNSYALKPEATPLLRTLAAALENVLGDAEVREYVDAITVQGHTDDRGSSAFNRELSAKRANAVLDFMFEAKPGLEQTYGSYFAASAYSEFRPLDDAPDEAAYEKNRRIEISVVLKDASVRKLIDQYMQNVENPAAAGAGGGGGAGGAGNDSPTP
jgi:chemotaxis protein MotB